MDSEPVTKGKSVRFSLPSSIPSLSPWPMNSEPDPKRKSVRFSLPTPSPPSSPWPERSSSLPTAFTALEFALELPIQHSINTIPASPLDSFHAKYVKPMPKKLLRWVLLKEPTQEALNQHRKDVYAFHHIEQDEEKERVAAILRVNPGQLPANRPGGKVTRSAPKFPMKVVDQAKNSIRRLLKAISHATKGTSEAQSNRDGASKSEVERGTGIEVWTATGGEAELRRRSRSQTNGTTRSGENAGSRWVAPADW